MCSWYDSFSLGNNIKNLKSFKVKKNLILHFGSYIKKNIVKQYKKKLFILAIMLGFAKLQKQVLVY